MLPTTCTHQFRFFGHDRGRGRHRGGDGVAAVAGLGLDVVADKPRFERRSLMALGEDVLETYARRE